MSDNALRKITPGGVVTTVAGGNPASVLSVPEGVTIDSTGTIYVLDPFSQAIRKMRAHHPSRDLTPSLEETIRQIVEAGQKRSKGV